MSEKNTDLEKKIYKGTIEYLEKNGCGYNIDIIEYVIKLYVVYRKQVLLSPRAKTKIYQFCLAVPFNSLKGGFPTSKNSALASF